MSPLIRRSRMWFGLGLVLLTALVSVRAAESKKIVLVAGTPSHGPRQHEHRAGCLLLQSCLSSTPGVEVVVITNGWPQDESVFDEAAALVFYCDGGGRHPAVQRERLAKLNRLMNKGVGFGAIHYGVEVPKDQGGPEFLDWNGGYFETYWSVNPHWDADFSSLPEHPVTRGVRPFQIRDEWYYHMRFRPDMAGVIPILSAIPPDSTRGREGANSSHGGNPHVYARRGQIEHVMWVAERPDNQGRGFGFTGGHFHDNWGHDDFRKVVLNAILWIAHVDVPPGGVASSVSQADLDQNLDPK